LAIRRAVVRVKGREKHGPLDAGLRRPPQIIAERRRRVPGTGQPVAFSGVAVAVDDHRDTRQPPGAGEQPLVNHNSSLRTAISPQRWLTRAGVVRPFASKTNCTIQLMPPNLPASARWLVTYLPK